MATTDVTIILDEIMVPLPGGLSACMGLSGEAEIEVDEDGIIVAVRSICLDGYEGHHKHGLADLPKDHPLYGMIVPQLADCGSVQIESAVEDAFEDGTFAMPRSDYAEHGTYRAEAL